MTHPHQELPLTEAPKCGCGGHDHGIPELNAVQIPHAIRHGAIHGALGQLGVGQSMILVAPHNPLPLLAEINQRPEEFSLEYLEEGPEWRLKFTRTA